MLRNRRSIRLRGYDYGSDGYYFVTICAFGRNALFGSIEKSSLLPTQIAKFIQKCIEEVPNHYPLVRVDSYVIMPNHVHIILQIDGVGANNYSPSKTGIIDKRANDYLPLHGTSRSLGALIRGIKVGVTKNCRKNNLAHTVWQRNYFERIIRNEKEYWAIRHYIADNSQNWEIDDLYQ